MIKERPLKRQESNYGTDRVSFARPVKVILVAANVTHARAHIHTHTHARASEKLSRGIERHLKFEIERNV